MKVTVWISCKNEKLGQLKIELARLILISSIRFLSDYFNCHGSI